MPQPIALTDLSPLFTQTAEAVARAQAALDTWSLERTRVYSIPTVEVDAKFALSTNSKGLLALLFGSTPNQTTHSLQFALRATPEAPSAGDLPSTLLSDRRTVCEPPWIVSVPNRLHLADVLALALRANQCTIDLPGFSASVDFFPEAEAIDAALSNKDDDSIGVVFFRLAAAPERYLIVRVGDAGIRNGHDGIFVLEPAADPPVTVYDFLTSPKNSELRYRPLEQLCAVLGQWLAGGLPCVPLSGDDLPAAFGAIPFADFAQGMWTSYVAARQAAAAADPSERAVYAIDGVAAQFAHAVLPPNGAGNNDSSPYIYSRVALQIAGGRMNGRLVSPEYLLVEDARDAFLTQLGDAVEDIAAEAAEDERDAWRVALKNKSAGATALIGLSYRGSKPKDEFLVVWPSPWNGSPSAFAFTCAIDKNGLNSVARCKGLADVTLARDGYVGFHNFLHSVRIWEMAGGWFAGQ